MRISTVSLALRLTPYGNGGGEDIALANIPATLAVKLFREGEHKRYKFERGDKIFVLPDPATLPPRSTEVDVDELDDDLWWVARILDCIKVDQSKENPDEPILGLFRVAVSCLNAIDEGRLLGIPVGIARCCRTAC